MQTAAEQEAWQRKKVADQKAQARNHQSRMSKPRAEIFGFKGDSLPRAGTEKSTVMK